MIAMYALLLEVAVRVTLVALPHQRERARWRAFEQRLCRCDLLHLLEVVRALRSHLGLCARRLGRGRAFAGHLLFARRSRRRQRSLRIGGGARSRLGRAFRFPTRARSACRCAFFVRALRARAALVGRIRAGRRSTLRRLARQTLLRSFVVRDQVGTVIARHDLASAGALIAVGPAYHF